MNYLLTVNLLFFGILAQAGGHSVGNGGDTVVYEFRTIAFKIFKNWTMINSSCSKSAILTDREFYGLIQSSKVESTDDALYLPVDGKKVLKEAINYPQEKLIVVNRDSFKASGNKALLVVHEILGVGGYLDENYADSEHILKLLESWDCRGGHFFMPSVPEKSFYYPSSFIDKSGHIYILDRSTDQILIFTLDGIRRGEIQLNYAPEQINYAQNINRIYVQNTGNIITYVDLDSDLKENFFLKISNRVSAIEAIGDDVLISTNELLTTGSVFYLYNAQGTLLDSTDYLLGTAEAWSEDNLVYHEASGYIYYIKATSTHPLCRFKLRNKKFPPYNDPDEICVDNPTIYHNSRSPAYSDLESRNPILFTENFVITGADQMFDPDSFFLVRKLYSFFEYGASSSSGIAIAVKTGNNYKLVKFDHLGNELESRLVKSDLFEVLSYQGHYYYLGVSDTGISIGKF